MKPKPTILQPLNLFEKYLRLFLAWRIKKIKDQPFIVFLAAIIGLVTGIAAVLIKNAAHLIKSILTGWFSQHYENYLYLVYPLAGIALTIIIAKYIIRKDIGHGIPATLYSISRQNSRMPKHNMFSSIITSAFTVGFGGSVGLEGPAVSTGSAIGANIGSMLKLNYKTRTLLIGCAVSGAMGALFKAPIAALVFAIEVIMLDLTFASLIPLLIASSIAVLTSYFFMGRDVLFHVNFTEAFKFSEVPYFIILGVFCGLSSAYFTKVTISVSKIFAKFKKKYIKILIGGLVLGVLIFILPPLYGEGYESVNSLLAGNFTDLMGKSFFFQFKDKIAIVFLFYFLLVLFKAVATAVTLSAGGVGGVFAPSLFLGSTIGFLFSSLTNFIGLGSLSTVSFTLVGMAGTIAGIMHAPLTSIFLIAEITGNYNLFIPLMLTAAISYTTVRYFSPYSIYTHQLTKSGDMLTHHKDKTVLTLLRVSNLIEKNFITMHPDQTLRDLVKVIKKSVRNIYPIVDEKGQFLGLIPLDNVRSIMFDQDLYDKLIVKEIMIQATESVSPDDNMDNVMEKFKITGFWNLPVIDSEGKYVGFVSRANIFNAYRKMLIEFSED